VVSDALKSGNLFAELPDARAHEVLETFLARGGVTIQRIVSHGQATPDGDWYDQDTDEWVVVLIGGAGLEIEGEGSVRELGPGDFVFLPARERHRVAWTSADEPTVWLAIHTDHAPKHLASV